MNSRSTRDGTLMGYDKCVRVESVHLRDTNIDGRQWNQSEKNTIWSGGVWLMGS
jgi:hypothetical protein